MAGSRMGAVLRGAAVVLGVLGSGLAAWLGGLSLLAWSDPAGQAAETAERLMAGVTAMAGLASAAGVWLAVRGRAVAGLALPWTTFAAAVLGSAVFLP